MNGPHCLELPAHRDAASPFTNVLIFDWHDGLVEGATSCATCRREYWAQMIAWDANGDNRLFRLRPLRRGTLAALAVAWTGHQTEGNEVVPFVDRPKRVWTDLNSAILAAQDDVQPSLSLLAGSDLTSRISAAIVDFDFASITAMTRRTDLEAALEEHGIRNAELYSDED